MKKFILLFTLYSASFSLPAFDIIPQQSLNGRIEILSRFSAGGKIINPINKDRRGYLSAFADDSRLYIFDRNQVPVKKVKLSSCPLYHAAGSDGILYCCFRDNTMRAYNSSGILLWEKKLEDNPVFPPVINSEGNIFIFCDNNSLSSFALNGRLRWKMKLDYPLESQPLSLLSNIICHDSKGVIRITDNGKILKGIECGADRVFTGGGRLFLLSGAGVSCYDRYMRFLWELPVSGEVTALKTGSDKIYFATAGGRLYISDYDGRIIREKGIPGSGYGSFTVLDRMIYILSDDGYLRQYNHDLEFIDRLKIPDEAFRNQGSVRSSSVFPEPVFTGEDTLAIGGADWLIYFFKTENDSEVLSADLFVSSEEEADPHYTAPDLVRINELSRSDRYENRMKALSLIEELISDGFMSAYEYEILEILLRLGSEGTLNLKGFHSSNEGYAVIRGKASDLIAEAGTEKSLSILRKMIRAEEDEYVIIKQLLLLGKGGSDPLYRTLDIFNYILEKRGYEKRTCSAVLSAMGDIASYYGYLPDKYSASVLRILDFQSDDRLKNKAIDLLVKNRQ